MEVHHPIFGRLTLEAIPYHDPILAGTFAATALGGLAIVAALTYFRLWGPFWRDWVTSIDHKRIGVMYIVLGLVMLLRGFADAIMMRAQQAVAFGDQAGFLPPHHYDQIFTAHGVIMIFFVAMPLVTGFMNYLVPLQIGARDVAFPFLNNFSFWMTTMGAALVMASLFVGEFARTGWLAYPPLSGIIASPASESFLQPPTSCAISFECSRRSSRSFRSQAPRYRRGGRLHRQNPHASKDNVRPCWRGRRCGEPWTYEKRTSSAGLAGPAASPAIRR